MSGVVKFIGKSLKVVSKTLKATVKVIKNVGRVVEKIGTKLSHCIDKIPGVGEVLTVLCPGITIIVYTIESIGLTLQGELDKAAGSIVKGALSSVPGINENFFKDRIKTVWSYDTQVYNFLDGQTNSKGKVVVQDIKKLFAQQAIIYKQSMSEAYIQELLGGGGIRLRRYITWAYNRGYVNAINFSADISSITFADDSDETVKIRNDEIESYISNILDQLYPVTSDYMAHVYNLSDATISRLTSVSIIKSYLQSKGILNKYTSLGNYVLYRNGANYPVDSYDSIYAQITANNKASGIYIRFTDNTYEFIPEANYKDNLASNDLWLQCDYVVETMTVEPATKIVTQVNADGTTSMVEVPIDPEECWDTQTPTITYTTGFVTYKKGSGQANIDKFFNTTTNAITMQFAPFIPLRSWTRNYTKDNVPTIYPWLRKASLKALGGRKTIDKTMTGIADNKDADKIDYAVYTFGIPINTQFNYGKKYIYNFISTLFKLKKSLRPIGLQYGLKEVVFEDVTNVASVDVGGFNFSLAASKPEFNYEFKLTWFWEQMYRCVGNYYSGSKKGQVEIFNTTYSFNFDPTFDYDTQSEYYNEKLYYKNQAGLTDAKKNAYTSFEAMQEEISLNPEAFNDGTKVVDNNLHIKYYVTDNQFIEYIVTNFTLLSQVLPGHPVAITAHSSLLPGSGCKFTVPVEYSSFRKLTLYEQDQCTQLMHNIYLNHYEFKNYTIKWYQRDEVVMLFKIVTVVVVVVITIVGTIFGGWGGPAGAGIYGAVSSFLVSVGFNAVVASICAHILIAVVCMIIAKLVAKWTNNDIIGAIVGFVCAIYSYGGFEGSLSSISDSLITQLSDPKTWVIGASKITDLYTKHKQTKLNKLNAELITEQAAFNAEYKQKNDELQDKLLALQNNVGSKIIALQYAMLCNPETSQTIWEASASVDMTYHSCMSVLDTPSSLLTLPEDPTLGLTILD